MQPGDQAVILASDGLWDVLSDSAAVAKLEQARCHPETRPDSTCYRNGHAAPHHQHVNLSGSLHRVAMVTPL